MTHEEIIERGGTSMFPVQALADGIDDYVWVWPQVVVMARVRTGNGTIRSGIGMSVLEVKAATALASPTDLGSVLEIELGRDLHSWPILSPAVK